jgi:hypothetical protein
LEDPDFRDKFIQYFVKFTRVHKDDFLSLSNQHENITRAFFCAMDNGKLEEVVNIAAAMGRYLITQGFWHQGKQWSAKAVEFAEELSSQEHLPSLKRFLGQACFSLGDIEEGLLLFHESLNLALELRDDENEARGLHEIGRVQTFYGEYSKARESLIEASNKYGYLSDPEGRAAALSDLAYVSRLEGEYATADRLLEQAWGEVAHSKINLILSRVNYEQGVLAMLRGEYEQASSLLQTVLDIYQEVQNRPGIATALLAAGQWSASVGDLASARLYYEEAYRIQREIGDRDGLSDTKLKQSKLFRIQKYLLEAQKLCEESLDEKVKLNNPLGKGRALLGLSELKIEMSYRDYEAYLADERNYRSELYRFLTERFNLEELRSLCFELGVNYDDLPGETLRSSARELALHMERHMRIPELVNAILRPWPTMRQNLDWAFFVELPEIEEAQGVFLDLGVKLELGFALVIRGRADWLMGDHSKARKIWQEAKQILEDLGVHYAARVDELLNPQIEDTDVVSFDIFASQNSAVYQARTTER